MDREIFIPADAFGVKCVAEVKFSPNESWLKRYLNYGLGFSRCGLRARSALKTSRRYTGSAKQLKGPIPMASRATWGRWTVSSMELPPEAECINGEQSSA